MDTIIGRNFGVSFVELCRQAELYWPIVSCNTIRVAGFVLGRCMKWRLCLEPTLEGFSRKNRIIKLIMISYTWIYTVHHSVEISTNTYLFPVLSLLQGPKCITFLMFGRKNYLMFSLWLIYYSRKNEIWWPDSSPGPTRADPTGTKSSPRSGSRSGGRSRSSSAATPPSAELSSSSATSSGSLSRKKFSSLARKSIDLVWNSDQI